MNKKGNMGDERFEKKKILQFVRNSYVYKLVKKILSIISSLLLILLLSLGGLMFYFNMQGNAASKQGIQYVAPFGLYTIISGSMEPNIKVYDVVAAVQVDDLSKIKIGDVITFVSTWELNYGTTVTHRVVAITKSENGDYSFTTKGDANASADGAYVTRENLIGKVIFRIPQLGRIQFFLATKSGWFVVVFVPALAVIIWDVVKIFRLKVLKNNISSIKTIDEAQKTYYDNDILDSREIDDVNLQKTMVMPIEVVEVEEHKEIVKEVSEKGILRKAIPKRENANRKPLPKREIPTEKKITRTKRF